MTQLGGRVLETALGAELTEHLGYPPGQAPPGGVGVKAPPPAAVRTVWDRPVQPICRVSGHAAPAKPAEKPICGVFGEAAPRGAPAPQ